MELASRWSICALGMLRKGFARAGHALSRTAARKAVGQGLVEYALIITLVAIVVIGALTTVGKRTNQVMDRAQCTLDGGTYHTDNGNGNSNRCR